MNPPSQGTSSSPADPPAKRKRGRPRKDESLVQGENMPAVPGSDHMKKNKQTMGTAAAAAAAGGGNMVGQLVTGVIDGFFDAGYLLKVKVGDSDTQLRGLVFLPGRFTPISAANDVAPQAKMYKRTDIPIPVSYPPTKLTGSVLPSEQSDKQPAQSKNVELQPIVPIVQDKQSASHMLPRTDNCQSSTGPFFGGKAMPHQVFGSGHVNQSASAMAQIGHHKIARQHDLLQEFEASLRKCPNLNVKANEQSKSVSQSSPPVDMLPGSGTVKMEVEFLHQLSGNDLKLNRQVHDGVKSASPLMEKQASTKNAAPPEPVMKITSGDDTSHLNGSPVNHAANITEAHTQPAPVTSFPSMLFEKEANPSAPKHAADPQKIIELQSGGSGATSIMKAESDALATTNLFDREVIPSESMIATGGPALPTTTEPQLSSSPAVANNVESNMKEAIPPPES